MSKERNPNINAVSLSTEVINAILTSLRMEDIKQRQDLSDLQVFSGVLSLLKEDIENFVVQVSDKLDAKFGTT